MVAQPNHVGWSHGYRVADVTARPSQTLADLRGATDALAGVQAARSYIEQLEWEITEAIKIRDAYLRKLIADNGPAATARLTGYGLSTVKTARKTTGK
jgi:hypothetical protein